MESREERQDRTGQDRGLLGTVEGADGGNGDGLLKILDPHVGEVSRRAGHGKVCIVHQHLYKS